MTQEQFNKMADAWIAGLAEKPVASWFEGNLAWGKKNGLMTGDDKGRLMPKKFLSREEFIAVLNRFYDKFVK